MSKDDILWDIYVLRHLYISVNNIHIQARSNVATFLLPQYHRHLFVQLGGKPSYSDPLLEVRIYYSSRSFPINKMKFFVFVLNRLLTYGKYLINSRRNPVVSKISMRKVRRMRSTLSNAGRISIRT